MILIIIGILLVAGIGLFLSLKEDKRTIDIKVYRNIGSAYPMVPSVKGPTVKKQVKKVVKKVAKKGK